MTIDESLYDEFGNYIGVSLEEPQNHESDTHSTDEGITEGPGEEDADFENQRFRQQIVLHEEKKYYLTAEEVYGPEIETLIQDEDTQPLSEPIIAPIKIKKFQIESSLEKMQPIYDVDFLKSLLNVPERTRNVAVCGHLHHGKTSLIDVLVASTHQGLKVPESTMPRYMDNLILEQERGLSLKSKAVTLLLPTLSGTSMAVNFIDTPGHVDFSDEMAAGMRMADGVIIVIDAVEGLMLQTEVAIRAALDGGLSIILLLNKVDRLFLELKVPPADAYYKLRHAIEEVNTFTSNLLSKNESQTESYFSPEKGNVLFASTLSGWIFSLESFAESYLKRKAVPKISKDSISAFAHRLWGDIYYNRATGRFLPAPAEGANKRTFVTFILEPLYKLYSCVLTEESKELSESLASVGVFLKQSECVLNTKTVLRLSLNIFMKNSVSAVTSSIVNIIPDPREASFLHVIKTFNGPLSSSVSKSIQQCSDAGPLVAFCCKAYSIDPSKFQVLVRVFSGTIRKGQSVRLISDSLNISDDELILISVRGLYIPCGRYRIPVNTASAGSLVLISGFDNYFSKFCTIVNSNISKENIFSFKPLDFLNQSLTKVAIEPLIPSDLPKFLDGLRKVVQVYPSLTTKVEESGEHIVFGTGELYMDCALHDLRRIYADVEVKVADPVAKFAETVAEMSYVKCFAETPNKKNKITIIAEPLETSVVSALELGLLPSPRSTDEERKDLAKILQNNHGWDILAARNVWAFGPDEKIGSCVLINDTLPSEVDAKALLAIKNYIIQGFQWACREGPLCEEVVRGVKFRIIDCIVADNPSDRAAGQLIPTVRRACYSALLTAAPRLMEPVSLVEILTLNDFVEAVYAVLAKRRGHVTQDSPKAGTPFYQIRAFLPLMDSFGFEADLRIHSQGMAFCQQRYDHWQMVSGDPLDSTIKLIPLEPSPAPYLARDYLLKTRRRKGLSEDVKIAKFFDEAMLEEVAREEAVSGIRDLQV